jgi:hypothetical protein
MITQCSDGFPWRDRQRARTSLRRNVRTAGVEQPGRLVPDATNEVINGVTEHSNAATEEHLKSGQAGGVSSVV